MQTTWFLHVQTRCNCSNHQVNCKAMNVNCLMKSSTRKSLILVVLSPSGSSSIPVLLPQPFELPPQAPSPNSILAPISQEDTVSGTEEWMVLGCNWGMMFTISQTTCSCIANSYLVLPRTLQLTSHGKRFQVCFASICALYTCNFWGVMLIIMWRLAPGHSRSNFQQWHIQINKTNYAWCLISMHYFWQEEVTEVGTKIVLEVQ